jgi:hypothetical protein
VCEPPRTAFGFDEKVFAEMQTLTDSILKSDWASRMLSRSFVEKTTIQWLQTKFDIAEPGSLSEAIAQGSRKTVEPLELWAPVAHLEVQTSFSVGPVEVKTITKAMIDGLEAKFVSSAPPDQRDKVSVLFDDIRKRMQGLAAIVFKLDGEPGKIAEDGEAIARIVVGLLRFFSPAAVNFPAVCANALLGASVVPVSNLVVLGQETFSYAQSMLSPNAPDWRISDAALLRMRPGLDAMGALVRPARLHAFALAVRSSLLLFGTGTTFFNPAERLTYTLSSLEGLLLRHSAEPAEFNIAERIGFLLTQDRAEREEVARNVREAYRLRSRQDISPISPREIGSTAVFLRNAHKVIDIALGNVGTFSSVPEFVNSIDNLRSSASAVR